MKFEFSSYSTYNNYWEIYNVLKKFYPIGLKKENGDGNYFKYEGIKDLYSIIKENIENEINYDKWWGNFTRDLWNKINKEIISTTYGYVPSFSASILIEKNCIRNCVHYKELHFSVSLIGNFYQIYGSDKTRIFEEGEQIGYTATNSITVSPFKEFEEVFNQVELGIKEVYPKYKIIPFPIGQSIIEGFQVSYVDDMDCSINMGLFNNFLSDVKIIGNIRGNILYGTEYKEIQR